MLSTSPLVSPGTLRQALREWHQCPLFLGSVRDAQGTADMHAPCPAYLQQTEPVKERGVEKLPHPTCRVGVLVSSHVVATGCNKLERVQDSYSPLEAAGYPSRLGTAPVSEKSEAQCCRPAWAKLQSLDLVVRCCSGSKFHLFHDADEHAKSG